MNRIRLLAIGSMLLIAPAMLAHGVRFGEKVRQPAQTMLLHETAKSIAYAQSLAAETRVQ